jgi:hypothetical protein
VPQNGRTLRDRITEGGVPVRHQKNKKVLKNGENLRANRSFDLIATLSDKEGGEVKIRNKT